jgi:hypothetical protein
VYLHRRRITAEIISQPESGVVFKHSLEYPDLQGIREYSESGNIQGTTGEHSGNIQGTFREHSGNIQLASGLPRAPPVFGHQHACERDGAIRVLLPRRVVLRAAMLLSVRPGDLR